MDAARLREIVARNREGLEGAHYLPVHADDLRVLLDLAEATLGDAPAVSFTVTAFQLGGKVSQHTTATRDAAARTATMLIEEGFDRVHIREVAQ